MVRDKEINRLVLYAKALGLKVIFKTKANRNDPTAVMNFDDKTIVVYRSKSKLDLVLTLVHELAHWKGYLADDKIFSSKVAKVLSKDYDKTMSDEERSLVYKLEEQDLQYWDGIIKDCDIKIKPERILLQTFLDMYPYEIYMLTGKDPTLKEKLEFKKAKKKQLKGNK